MFNLTNRTLISSILYLDIVNYSRQHVAEQIRLKGMFNAMLSECLLDIAINDHIILDTGDGAAISFLGAPEDALFVAMSLRDASTKSTDHTRLMPIRIGINLGPVRQIRNLNGSPHLLGDGVGVAQHVMNFCEPGEILVSRSYFEMVSRLNEEFTSLFEHAGIRADKHVREYEVYSVSNKSPLSGYAKKSQVTPKFDKAENSRPTQLYSKRILITLGVVAIFCAAIGIVCTQFTGPVVETVRTPQRSEVRPAGASVSRQLALPAMPQMQAPQGPASENLKALPAHGANAIQRTTPVSKVDKESEVGRMSHTSQLASRTEVAVPIERSSADLKAKVHQQDATESNRKMSSKKYARSEPAKSTQIKISQARCFPGECWSDGSLRRDK